MTTCSNCSYSSDIEFHFCPECGTKAIESTQAEDPLPGKTLNGKYRVLAPLGSGSMGTVYLGEHVGLRKRVALKVLHADLQVDDETLSRFQREGIAAGKFTHPNAIQIFDFDRHDKRVVYLAMEYVEGVDLKTYLRERGALPFEDALRIARQILSVLSMAHSQGIVHRDLKPDNIMIVRGAGDPDAKVLDFGLSKLIDRPLEASMQTQVGRIIGTPLYMSPEQCAGEEVDHRTDLYAVGLIMYEMVAGSPPFRGDTVAEIFSKHISQDAPSVHASNPKIEVPGTLDAFLVRCLEKDRNARFSSAHEMLAALDEVEGGRAARGSHLTRRPRAGAARGGQASPWVRRGLLAFGAVLALIGIVALAVWLMPRLGSRGDDLPRVSMMQPEHRSELQQRYVKLLEESRGALRDRDTAGALDLVDDAMQLSVADSEAYFVRALAYRQGRDDDTAQADLVDALERDPGYAAAAAQLGWIAFDRGDFDEAAMRFDEAAEMDAGCADALAGSGAVLSERGDLEQARATLERAVALDSTHALGHATLGRVQLEQDDPEGATASFVEAKRSDPRMWSAWSGLGQAYLARGDVERASTQLEQAVELAPDEYGPRIALASLLIEAERFSDAQVHVRAALDKAPQVPELAVLEAVLLSERGEDDQAIAALERAVAGDPSNADALLLLGVLELEAGHLRRAVSTLESAVAQQDDLLLAWIDLGLARFQLQEVDGARAALERALELDPDALDAHYALGILCMDYLGDPSAARQHLTRYRELGGRDARADTWIARLPQ